MLETIHEYAREKLQASGEEEEVRRRHAEHFLALARAAGERLPEAEHDNMRAALAALHELGDARGLALLSYALLPYWLARGHLHEGREWLETALALHPAPDAVRADLTHAICRFALRQGDFERLRTVADEQLRLAGALDDDVHRVFALSHVGIAAAEAGDLSAAAASFEESLALAERIGDAKLQGMVLGNLGNLADLAGEPDRAVQLEARSLELSLGAGDQEGVILSMVNLGDMALLSGEAERALASGRAAIDHARRTQLSGWISYPFQVIARALALRGDDAEAVRFLAAGDTRQQSVGLGLSADDTAAIAATRAELERRLGEESFQAHWREGQAWELDEALARAGVRPGIADEFLAALADER